jgi:hypothetical protein
MQPEDAMDGRRLPPAGDELPGDADSSALEAELTAAGARARRGTPGAPTPTFAAALRDRLVASFGAPEGEAMGATAAVATWPATTHGATSSRARGADDPKIRLLPTGPVSHEPARLAVRTATRIPTVLPAPRWSILAAAAAIVVAVVGLNAGVQLPAPPDSRVAAAVGAELIRAGQTSALVSGAQLRADDEIRVAAGGSAALQLGDSRIRLDGGADVRLEAIERSRIAIDQLAGRAWHRVVLPDAGRYVVTTGDVTWTATGTAFDLDRRGPGAAGGDVVHELSVEHAVVVEGPGLRVSVDQGRGATVRLGAAPTVTTTDVSPATAAADPWIRANAAEDAADGLPLGLLDGIELAAATARPTANVTPLPTPSAEPSAPPVATVAPTLAPTAPTAPPTPRPTPVPTPVPTPTPVPAPTMGTMGLAANACPGGVVLDWTVPELAAFHHVQVLRGSSGEIPAVNPPAGGVVAIGGGYSTNPAKSEGMDPTAEAGAAWYRAVTFDTANQAIAASPVLGVTTAPIGDLGGLGFTDGAPGSGDLTFTWSPFGGNGDCFTYYKLVASIDDPTPSYLGGSTALVAIGERAASGTTVTDGLTTGQAYYFRIQVIRATAIGKFVVAQSAVSQYVVP